MDDLLPNESVEIEASGRGEIRVLHDSARLAEVKYMEFSNENELIFVLPQGRRVRALKVRNAEVQRRVRLGGPSAVIYMPGVKLADANARPVRLELL